MPIPELRPVNPAGQVVAREMGRLADAVEQQSRVSGDATVEVRQNAAGVQFDAPLPEEFWARISSPPDATTHAYAWNEVEPVVAAGALGWTTDSSFRNGTTTVNPAYELNGNTAVPYSPDPTVVRMRRAAGGEFYTFTYCCRDASVPVAVAARTVVRVKRTTRRQTVFVP